MENYGKATEYTTASINSSGTAMEKYAAYEDSIEGKTKKLQASMELFASKTLSSDVVKGFVDGANAIVSFGNAIGSIQSIITAGIVVFGAYVAIAKIRDAMGIKSVKTIQSEIAATLEQVAANTANTASVVENTVAEEANTLSRLDRIKAMVSESKTVGLLTKNLGFLGVALLAVGASYAIFKGGIALGDYFKETGDSVSEATKKLDDIKAKFDGVTQELTDINSELATNRDRIAELQAMGSLTYVEQTELDNLKEATKQLELQAEEKKKEQQATAEAYYTANKNALKAYDTSSSGNTTAETVSRLQASPDSGNQISLASLDTNNLSDSIAAIKYLKSLMEKTDDESLLTDYQDGIDAFSGKLETGITELEKLRTNLIDIKSASGEWSSDQAKDYATIESELKTLYSYTNPDTWNTVEVSDIIDTKGIEKTKDELIAMAKAGTLDENTISQYSFLNDTIQNSGIIVEDGKTKTEMFVEQIKALAEESDDASTSVDSLSTTVTALTTAYASLEDSASLLQSVNEAFSDGEGLSSDMINNILTKYPQMADALYDYMAGLISENDLFAQLEDSYNTDKDNYLNTLLAKYSANEDFWSKLVSSNSEVTDLLAQAYNGDYSNFKSLAEAKLALDNQLISTLKANWLSYYTAQKDAMGIYTLTSSSDDSDFTAEDETRRLQEKALYDQYNSAISSLNSSSISGLNSNLNLSWSGVSGGSSSSSSSDTSEMDSATSTSKAYDMIARAVQSVADRITNLGKVVSNTYRNWSDRNSALSQEMNAVSQQISNQQQAYQTYMNLANSVGLDEGIASMIRNGSMGEFTTSDETLQSQIDSYMSYYDSATAAASAVEDLRTQLGDLAKTNFDNVSSQYEAKLQDITHMASMINSDIDITEKKGYMVSAEYYKSLISIQTDNISKLTEESNALQSSLQQALNSGAIDMYSEAWASMDNQINSVSESIKDATSSLTEYITALQKVEWDKFDYIRESVSAITTESDFLINLLSTNKSTTNSSGLSDEGNAVLGLRAVNYNTYMSQADEYRQAVEELNAELAQDPYNTTMIERRDALLKLQQESITSAESEKQSIVELIKSGYDAEKSALQDLIDAKNEYNQTVTDEYDYQKNVTEQAKAISEYKKQLEAYKNDISEDTKAKVQTITVSLKEAQQTLAETERQQAISDQEKLLSNLMDEADAVFEGRMDNVDALLSDVISQTNASSEEISTTISSAASEVGYTLTDAMSSIWKGDGGVTSVISKYGEGFLNSQTTLQSTINGIKSGIDAMVSALNAQAQATVSADTSGAYSSSTDYSSSGSSDSGSSSGGSSSGGSSGDFFIYSPDQYPKDQLLINSSIVDRLKYNNFASDFNSRAYYYEQMGLGSASDYYGSYDQNVAELQWMKNAGYKQGAKSTGSNETNWVHENELVIRPNDNAFLTPLNGGAVFNESQTDYLWDLSNTKSSLSDNVSSNNNTGSGSNLFSIAVDSINMTGVNDPKSFTDSLISSLSENAMVKKAVSEVAIGVGLGNNSLKINSYR